MKINKNWINDLSEDQLQQFLKSETFINQIPADLDQKFQQYVENQKNPVSKSPYNNPNKITYRLNPVFRFPVLAGLTLCLILGIYLAVRSFIMPINSQPFIGTPIVLNGQVSIEHPAADRQPDNPNRLMVNSVVITGNNSDCILQLGMSAVTRLDANSRVKFLKPGPDSTANILLENGGLALNVKKLPKNTTLQVMTRTAVITVIGTEFSVRSTDLPSTIISVKEGRVKIARIGEEAIAPIIIGANQTFEITADKVEEKSDQPSPDEHFKALEMYPIQKLNNPSSIKFKTDNGSTNLTINHKDNYQFDSEIELTLEPGRYLFEFYRKGYDKDQEEIQINPGDHLYKEIILTKAYPVNDVDDTTRILEYGPLKLIYQRSDIDPSVKPEILGFIQSQNYLIAQTQSSLICFDAQGRLKWENKYGTEKKMVFMSMPLIYEGKIYLSSLNKKFLIIDLLTGKEQDILDASGNIAFGYTSAVYQNKLYLPYINSIQIFLLQNNIFDEKLFIPFNNATVPLLIENRMYLSSNVDKNLVCYNLNGEKIWSYSMNQRSYNSPLYYNGAVFASDYSGTVYKLTPEGMLLKQNMLPGAVVSGMKMDRNFLYILANDGIVYQIQTQDLTYRPLFKADNKVNESDYLFKSPLISNQKIWIGTNQGEVLIYDLYKNQLEKTIKLEDQSISCTIIKMENNYIIGTKDGKIFLIPIL